MLSHDLLSQLDLLVYKSLFVLPVGIVMISVHGCRPHFDIVSFSVSFTNFERVHDSIDSFLSQFLLSPNSASLTPDHPLLIFFSHVFFVCDRLVQFVPVVFPACIWQMLLESNAQNWLISFRLIYSLFINKWSANWLISLTFGLLSLVCCLRWWLALILLWIIWLVLLLIIWICNDIVISDQLSC